MFGDWSIELVRWNEGNPPEDMDVAALIGVG